MSQANSVVHAQTTVSSTKKRFFDEDSSLRKIWQHRRARYSLSFLLGVILVGILGPWLAPHNPTLPFYDAMLAPPSAEHWLGTDAIGRDVFSRMLYGTRVTLVAGLLTVSITLVVGTLIGVVSAYVGGTVDNFMMRIMDILLAIPGIIMAMAIVAILGPSLTNAMIAVGIATIPSFARFTRGATLSIKAAGYVEASRAIGSSSSFILKRQILPNILNSLVVYTTLHMGIAILDTAALSFIGLGAQPPTPEWGTMLAEGKEYVFDAWWLATFPGLAITIVVFGVNILGDSLRDIFDPRTE